MKKIRINNDIKVRWEILDGEGNPYPLADKSELRLTLFTGMTTAIPIEDFDVEDTNRVVFDFYGKDQRHIGLYILQLEEKSGEVGMKVVDTKEVFTLVAHSWQVGGEDECSHLKTHIVSLTTKIESGIPGKSAYEIAVEHGFIGTEEEWLESLKAAAEPFDDTLSALPEPTAKNYEIYKNKIVCVPIVEGGEVVGFDNYRLAWNLDTENPVYFWAQFNGSGGDAILTSDLEVSNPMGKYAMGDVIAKDTPLETVFRGILSKTYYPALTNPSASIADSYPTLAEVGVAIAAANVRVNFSRGSINPKYTAESSYRSGEATGYSLTLNGASVQYTDSNANGQFSVPAFTRDSKGNVTLAASVSYEGGVQPKDSDGNDYMSPLPAGSASASKTIEFILPFYHGVANSNQIADLAGLVKDLTKKGNKTYTFTTDNQYAVIAYDAAYGNLKEIIDQNGFEVQWVASEEVVGGQTYKVYVAAYATTATNSKFTFNF